MKYKHYSNGRELMHAVFRGEMTDRLPRNGKEYLNVMFAPEFPHLITDGKGYDLFGVEHTMSPDGFVPGKGVIEDIADWRRVHFPSVDEYEMEEDAQRVKKLYDPDTMMLRMSVTYSHFERMWSLLGFEESLVSFYSDPDSVHEFMDELTEQFIAKMKKIKECYSPDIIVFHDDWGGNSNMFFSPELWREFFKPRIKRLVDTAHELGMYYEQHSCGHIQEIIGDLVEIGVDCLQPLMPTCNDIPMIKKTYGDKIVLSGCVDTRGIVDSYSNEETVRAKAREPLELCAPGGRFLPSLVIYGEGNEWKAKVVEEELDKFEEHFFGQN